MDHETLHQLGGSCSEEGGEKCRGWGCEDSRSSWPSQQFPLDGLSQVSDQESNVLGETEDVKMDTSGQKEKFQPLFQTGGS